MTSTNEIIGALVADALPVRRLRHPAVRACGWVAVAVVTAAVIAALHGVRPDLGAKLADARFGVALASAALTGALAALAVMMASNPDRSPRWLWLPVPTALVWLTTVSGGCLADWVSLHNNGLALRPVLECLVVLAMATAPLSVALFWLLRPLGRIMPRGAVPVACLAVGAFAAATLNFVHRFDASAVILAANFGAAALVMLVDAAIAPFALRRVRSILTPPLRKD